MDPQADSEAEVIVLSTSDNVHSAEPTPRARKAKPFLKSFGFLPSLRRESFKTAAIRKTRPRKYWEIKFGRQATEHLVNNYYITGGFGGSGGEGGDQGGDGGTGQGPTVYFGQPETREPSDFRTIRRGDLKLLKEVRLSTESGVVSRQSREVDVRRAVYHAEIRGDPGIVTVAMYQGDGAEEEWRKHVATYKSMWHPNIMQLYGLVSTKELYAMVFHDELIPYAQFRRRFEHSPILRTYIIGYCRTEWQEATNYIGNVIGSSMETSVWIRPSTGQLCLDLAQGGPETSSDLYGLIVDILRLENVSLDAPDSENIIISSLSEDQYHELCSWPPIIQYPQFQVSTEHVIGPGIFRRNSQHGSCVRITEPLQMLYQLELHWNNYGNAPDELLPNLYDSHRTNTLPLELRLPFWEHGITKAWLAQASRIFAELEEGAHVEDYICIGYLQFSLRIANKRDIPEGYLFVCPPQDFCTELHAHLYQWPACPAYWSLDPSGADRLSMEDARILGFPSIHIETVVHGYSWDCSVYKGLRRFHEGKGFDPDSREVARQLGYPLFEVSSNCVPFLAHKVSDWPWPGECKQDDPALCRSLGHYL
ncbi:hypothetical protein MSAN_01498800 [Mycena sanguinolenta]|uniref:Uncharacterized protein n=1 Tax=Mycena sanguinolenta TaxID=230812 RepID=A0A8H6Y2X5_9AGAR|nr:hypothetical protein MSAN_01498800 [Mycena sanguinolenta]